MPLMLEQLNLLMQCYPSLLPKDLKLEVVLRVLNYEGVNTMILLCVKLAVKLPLRILTCAKDDRLGTTFNNSGGVQVPC